MAKYCSSCGNPLSEQANFCPHCGRRMGANPATQSDSQAEPAAPSPTYDRRPYSDSDNSKDTPDWQQPESQFWHQRAADAAPAGAAPGKARKRRKPGLVIGLGCVLAAGLTALACFVWPGFLRRENTEPAPTLPASVASETAARSQTTEAPTERANATESESVTQTQPSESAETASGSTPSFWQAFSNPFSDVSPEDPHYAEYCWAHAHELLPGEQLAGDTALTRSEFITMLWKAFDAPTEGQANMSFHDVDAEDECYPAVLWACGQKLISVPDTGLFSPNDGISRDQAAFILCHAAGEDGADQARAYLDVSPRRYFSDAVNWGYAAGVFERSDDFCFRPSDPLLRAEFACWLARTREPSLALKPFLPKADPFESYGISVNLREHGVAYFTAQPKNDDAVPKRLKVTVESYEIFEQAEDYEPREDYEWRKGVFVIDYADADADEYVYSLYVDVNDTNYVHLFESNRQINEDHTETSWVIAQGVPCKVYINPLSAEKIAHALYRVSYAVQVPIGYDGLVVRINSAENEPEAGEYFYEKYKDPAAYVFFRYE